MASGLSDVQHFVDKVLVFSKNGDGSSVCNVDSSLWFYQHIGLAPSIS